MNKTEILQIGFGVIIGIVLTLTLSATHNPSIPDISDEEKLNDLNNTVARNAFCQAMGYANSTLVGLVLPPSYVDPYEEEYASHSDKLYYRILCIRNVREQQGFDYDVYKKWMISLEIKT